MILNETLKYSSKIEIDFGISEVAGELNFLFCLLFVCECVQLEFKCAPCLRYAVRESVGFIIIIIIKLKIASKTSYND